MANLAELDGFITHPFHRIRNMGFIKHKSSWEWEKPYDYACFYCVAAGSITLTLEGRQYTAAEGDVIFLKQSDGGAKLGSVALGSPSRSSKHPENESNMQHIARIALTDDKILFIFI